jgi:hypothetical protein
VIREAPETEIGQENIEDWLQLDQGVSDFSFLSFYNF